jgi:fructose-1,6-bisphosphatase/inositol monophosphatase family enzyme
VTGTTTIPDPRIVADLIRNIALVEVLPRFRQLARHEVREKSPGDLVTVADEAMEAALAPKLTALLPGSLLVGEEDSARDQTVMQRLASHQPIWIIDPVDGTANFAAGREEFGVMLALVEHDEVLAGWIYEPVHDRMSYAVRGSGAFHDGRRLSRPGVENTYRGVLSVGFKGDLNMAQRVQKRRDRVHPIKSVRCAAIEYMRLARGEVDFVMFSGTMPWDHAPGAAILQELGGTISYFDGKGYRPSGALQAGGILAARDRATWDEAYKRLLADD